MSIAALVDVDHPTLPGRRRRRPSGGRRAGVSPSPAPRRGLDVDLDVGAASTTVVVLVVGEPPAAAVVNGVHGVNVRRGRTRAGRRRSSRPSAHWCWWPAKVGVVGSEQQEWRTTQRRQPQHGRRCAIAGVFAVPATWPCAVHASFSQVIVSSGMLAGPVLPTPTSPRAGAQRTRSSGQFARSAPRRGARDSGGVVGVRRARWSWRLVALE